MTGAVPIVVKSMAGAPGRRTAAQPSSAPGFARVEGDGPMVSMSVAEDYVGSKVADRVGDRCPRLVQPTPRLLRDRQRDHVGVEDVGVHVAEVEVDRLRSTVARPGR